MTTNQLKLLKECFKNELEDIGTLQINIKYDNDIIITDNVLNDIYHLIYNNNHDEYSIITAINELDADITAFYDPKPMYFYVRITNAVNTNHTYNLNKVSQNLKEKYKMITDKLLELYIKSCN